MITNQELNRNRILLTLKEEINPYKILVKIKESIQIYPFRDKLISIVFCQGLGLVEVGIGIIISVILVMQGKGTIVCKLPAKIEISGARLNYKQLKLYKILLPKKFIPIVHFHKSNHIIKSAK